MTIRHYENLCFSSLLFFLFTASISGFAQKEWVTIHPPELEGYNLFDLHATGDTLTAIGYFADGATSTFKSVILTSQDNGLNWDQLSWNGRFMKSMDVNGDGDIYAGGYGLGSTSFIMKSEDGGVTWADHLVDNVMGGISHIQFVDGNRGYASGYGAIQFLNPNIYETVDGGETWNVILDDSPEFTTFDQLSIHGENVYALSSVYFDGSITGNELNYSADTGKTWIQILDHDNAIGGMSWRSEWVGFIVTDAGKIEKSTDGGVNWSPVHTVANKALFAIDIQGDKGYATGEAGTLLQTQDAGESWTSMDAQTKRNLSGIVQLDDRVFMLGQDGIILEWREPSGDGGGGGGSGGPKDWPIGIDTPEQADVSLFPNPVTNKVLSISAQGADQIQLELFSASGQLVMRKRLEPQSTLSLAEISQGIYHYQIANTQGRNIANGTLMVP